MERRKIFRFKCIRGTEAHDSSRNNLLPERHLKHVESWNGQYDDGQVRRDIEHNLRNCQIVEARAATDILGVARTGQKASECYGIYKKHPRHDIHAEAEVLYRAYSPKYT